MFSKTTIFKYRYIVYIFTTVFWLGIIFFASSRPVNQIIFGVVFLGSSIVLYSVLQIEDYIKKNDWIRIGVFTMIIVFTLIETLYIIDNFEALAFERLTDFTTVEGVLAIGLLFCLLYITYREFGKEFTGTLLLFILYGFLGPLIPGILGHNGITLDTFLLLSVLNIKGAYGQITQIMGTWVALFLLYSGLARTYGVFEIMQIYISRLVERFESGVSQSAVVMSMVVGSITGATTANVGITGAITIPLMKESGVPSHKAGAIESVASTGGQILPPVMGAAVFLMVNFTGVPYRELIILAAIPALLFYFSVIIGVRNMTIKEIRNKPDIELTTADSASPLEILQHIIPFATLIYLLVIAGYPIMYSAFITVLVTITTGMMIPLIRDLSFRRLRTVLGDTLEGFQEGAEITVKLTVIAASIAVILEVLSRTGAPVKLTIAIMDLSGGVFIIAILLTLIVSIVLGFGMPTLAAYLIVAILVAPSLVRNFGIAEVAVHFFVLYASVLAAITPPIAVAVVVATTIADSNFWKTAWWSVRLGAPLFVLPFIFVIYPELLVRPTSNLILLFLLFIGMPLITFGLTYEFETHQYLRSFLYTLLGCIVLFAPFTSVKIIVAAISIGLILRKFNSKRLNQIWVKAGP